MNKNEKITHFDTTRNDIGTVFLSEMRGNLVCVLHGVSSSFWSAESLAVPTSVLLLESAVDFSWCGLYSFLVFNTILLLSAFPCSFSMSRSM